MAEDLTIRPRCSAVHAKTFRVGKNVPSISVKVHNSAGNLEKNHLDIAYINSNTKFGKILSICSKDIEQKRNSDFNQGP